MVARSFTQEGQTVVSPSRPLRVLMVTEDIPAPQIGGLGKHVVTLGNALIKAGHEVRLLGRAGQPYNEFREGLAFDGDFVGGFDFEGMGWKEAAVGAWLPYKRLAMARRVERVIAEYGRDVDVVHYHGHLPMVGLSLPRRMNFLQTRHDQGSECITQVRFRNGQPCDALAARDCATCIHASPGPLRKAVSAMAVNQYRAATARNFESRKVIFVSDFLRRQFVRAVPGVDLRNTRVIHNFVSLHRLREASHHVDSVRPGQVLLAARLDESKGVGAFLEAFVALLRPGQQVLVVGDGPQGPALRQRYSDVADLRFLGWLSNAEVLALTRMSHVCVVPSVWQEPCATTILEPLVLGRPTFALHRGGSPELHRYQRYSGQLRLEPDIAALALAVAATLKTDPNELPLPEQSDADVAHAVPSIVRFYGERGTVA